MGAQVWARRPFKYAGLQLDRGQIFELRGAVNDASLLALGYVQEIARKQPLSECAGCGAKFTEAALRDAHGKKQHSLGRPLTPMEQDARREREERLMEQVAPLNLE